MDNLNIINDLFLAICNLIIFISLFKLYYGSKSHVENDIMQKSLIRVISFFIVFFILFYYVNFYIINHLV